MARTQRLKITLDIKIDLDAYLLNYGYDDDALAYAEEVVTTVVTQQFESIGEWAKVTKIDREVTA